MSDAPINNPAEFAEKQAKMVREAAIQSLTKSREAFEKVNSATKGALDSIDASSTIVTKGFSEFNAKAIEALQANSNRSLEFFAAVASARTPADAFKLPADHASKQFEALNAQAKDLSSLARKIAEESLEPLKEQFARTFQPSA